MNISSMTGFGRASGHCEIGDVAFDWAFEAKSVNAKNFDFKMRAPQMLENMGLSTTNILKFLTICPRGYFMDGELCIYQGYDMTPGAKWALTDDGKKIVQQYSADLRVIFNLNDQTCVYTGVIVGKIGDVWKKINMVRLKTLENQNIVM